MTSSTSTTAIVIDDRTTQERWVEHIKGKLGMASTKVLLIGGSLVSSVSYLWPATTAGQGAVMDALGIAGVWKVLVPLMVAWAFAAFTPPKAGRLPQWALDILSELAHEKLSAMLVAAGHAPLPPKPSAVTAEPNVMVIGGPVQRPTPSTSLAPAVHIDPDDDPDYPETMPPPVAPAASPVLPVAPPVAPVPAPAPPMPGTATVLAAFGTAPPAPPALVEATQTLARQYRDAYPTLSTIEIAAKIERDLRGTAP